jgi:hypothetical protein
MLTVAVSFSNKNPEKDTAVDERLSLLLLKSQAANLISAGWVDGGIALLYVTNNTFFVYHERRAIAEAHLLVVNAVLLDYLAFEIAEEREGDAYLFAEGFVGSEAINADSQDLCICGFEFGEIRLIRL